MLPVVGTEQIAPIQWVVSASVTSTLQASFTAIYMHDAMYLYAMVVDKMIKRGIDIRNGSAAFVLAKESSFLGLYSIIL